MSERNTTLKALRESSGIRLAVLFGSFFILLIFSSLISSLISSMPQGDERTHILCSSIIQCILVFCLPAFILARFSSENWSDWLKLTKAPTFKAIFGVVLVYLLSLPAMEWLIDLNANISFPESLSSLEETFRNWENANEKVSQVLLETNGVFSVICGVMVIGVLTGFSEELFFRGGLQGIFIRTSLRVGGAVWLAAFIFSCMHFQFFGFLPRLLMGAFFGYLFFWTKSIWVPVFAHVLNNSVVVITSAILGDNTILISDFSDHPAIFENPFVISGSICATFIFLLVFKDPLFKNNQFSKKWQKSQLPSVSEN